MTRLILQKIILLTAQMYRLTKQRLKEMIKLATLALELTGLNGMQVIINKIRLRV